MPQADRPRARAGRYIGVPSIQATASKRDLSDAAREISAFIRQFESNRALQAVESAKQANLPLSRVMEANGAGREIALQKNFGWYWEPVYHDFAFFEEMRDSVATLSGAYESFADFLISGLNITCSDPKKTEALQKLLFNSRVNFYEVVRRSAFEIASIGNSYCIPRFTGSRDNFAIKNFQPVRATAMRVLRDETLAVEGYVQLLHRPTEFLVANAPSVPTFFLAEEVCHGYTFTKNWYAYGAPPFTAVPFVTKLKLTMERDIAEILHKHVPRMDVKYSPEQQMTQEKVDDHIDKLKSDLESMAVSQDMVHTPDVEVDIIGPNGKMVDATGTQNHVEDQLFRVLPWLPDLMGSAVSINPIQAQQRWRVIILKAKNIRKAVETMFDPVLERLQKELRLPEKPVFTWDSLDEETEKTQAETQELHIANANTMRDSGLIDQDQAAQHATQKHAVPQKKAAQSGPTEYYSNQPPDAGDGESGKVKNKDKGPSGKKTPKTDSRPRGKRHALEDVFEGIFNDAMERIREIGPLGMAEILFGDSTEGACQEDSIEPLSIPSNS